MIDTACELTPRKRGKKDKSVMDFSLHGNQLEQGKQFQYLGRTITENQRYLRKVHRRVAVAKSGFNKNREQFTRSRY